ncbi:RimK family alpha-L-glutamate ligase [Mycobacterium sp. NPDC051804]|uniref:RimK family alpha-L-glutamate ligase n=1 Tax=Mycobacterium sp. NPDC051804 TaxID=3364295 RepID=UPI00378DAF27
MKLARPDVFHPRIVLAGCQALPEGDGDDAELVAALSKHGLHARWLPWDDPDTLRADLVILRATWDYIERLDEFLDWTTRVRNLVNAPAVVAWNTDKKYLADLAEAGVPVVPGRFIEPGQRVHIPSGEVVVKPSVGAGSVGAQRFGDRDAARRHVAALHVEGRTALVQPYDRRVEDGETAMVFLGGRQSHAFTKGPILPSPGSRPAFDDSGTYAEESLTPAEPDFELWDIGHAALAAAGAYLRIDVAELLYARVDVIGGPTDPQVLELELVEPSLGWRQLDAATRSRRQRDFVSGVEGALERLGLGPLSHRRP